MEKQDHTCSQHSRSTNLDSSLEAWRNGVPADEGQDQAEAGRLVVARQEDEAEGEQLNGPLDQVQRPAVFNRALVRKERIKLV